jgi:hypothetical protein
VVITGEVEISRCLDLLRDTLGRIGSRNGARGRPPASHPRGPRAFTEITVERPLRVEDTILVAWPGDRSKPWDYRAARAIVFLLGETEGAGLLGRRLVSPGWASSALASLEEEGAPGFLLVQATADGRGGSAVAARIRETIEQAARGTFDGLDLEKWTTYEGLAANRHREDRLAFSSVIFDALLRAPQRPDRLTLAQLNDTARRLLKRGRLLAFVGTHAGAPVGSRGTDIPTHGGSGLDLATPASNRRRTPSRVSSSRFLEPPSPPMSMVRSHRGGATRARLIRTQ